MDVSFLAVIQVFIGITPDVTSHSPQFLSAHNLVYDKFFY